MTKKWDRLREAVWLPILLFIISAVLSIVFIVLAKREPDHESVAHNFFEKLSDAMSYVAAATLSSVILIFIIELAGQKSSL